MHRRTVLEVERTAPPLSVQLNIPAYGILVQQQRLCRICYGPAASQQDNRFDAVCQTFIPAIAMERSQRTNFLDCQLETSHKHIYRPTPNKNMNLTPSFHSGWV